MTLSAISQWTVRHRCLAVWSLRVVIGALFVVSGVVKAIDLWGFVYKIEEYLTVWDFMQPRSLVEMTAIGVSGAEFVLGAMLMVGAYRRSAVWGLLAMMCVMLPLTAYVYLYDPVSDCGCFGDFITLSNGATFIKNIIITAALIYLAADNRKVQGLYHPYMQWVVAALCCGYLLFVGLYGLMVQPMIDFRSFPSGSSLWGDTGGRDMEDVVFEFIYEKDGERRTFTAENLPDSTWTFIDRTQSGGAPVTEWSTEFYLTDGGEDVTGELADETGDRLIIVLPQYSRADVSYTFVINELQQYVESLGGDLIEVAAIDSSDIDAWRDLSMAAYPIYQGESTMLKELARGVMAAVYLKDGRIEWKRSLGSIDADLLEKYPAGGDINALDLYKTLDAHSFAVASGLLVAMLAALFLIGRTPSMLKWVRKNKNYENNE